ncbi:MAG: hypothetical protein ACUVRD_00930 [Bacteroidia bacterium]
MLRFALGTFLYSQTGVGLRFIGDFNYLTRRSEEPVVQGSFSNVGIGITYKNYYWGAGIELAANYIYKGTPSELQLPLVTKDFRAGQVTAFKGIEIDFRFGPRWKIFYPRTGIIGGYRWQSLPFSTDTSRRNQSLYFLLPLGMSLELPVQFGTTGVAVYYEIGLTNALKPPKPGIGYEGSKLRRVVCEIHVMYGKSR